MLRASDIARIEIPEQLPDIPLPPLPEILDLTIRKQVFTHTSFIAAPKQYSVFEEELFHHDNEKLEHVGDALLGCVVTMLLHDLYPTLNPGNATVMKAILVCNETLSQLSKRYKMPDRLITDVNASSVLRNGTKTTANIFEAYVAGLFYSFLQHGEGDATEGKRDGKTITRGDGIIHLEAWLRPLFVPIAEWVLDYMKKDQERVEEHQRAAEQARRSDAEDADLDIPAVGATATVNQHFMKNGAGMPEYVFEPMGTDMWLCKVIAVDRTGREWIGEATRAKKKLASTVAAYKIILLLQALT